MCSKSSLLCSCSSSHWQATHLRPTLFLYISLPFQSLYSSSSLSAFFLLTFPNRTLPNALFFQLFASVHFVTLQIGPQRNLSYSSSIVSQAATWPLAAMVVVPSLSTMPCSMSLYHSLSVFPSPVCLPLSHHPTNTQMPRLCAEYVFFFQRFWALWGQRYSLCASTVEWQQCLSSICSWPDYGHSCLIDQSWPNLCGAAEVWWLVKRQLPRPTTTATNLRTANSPPKWGSVNKKQVEQRQMHILVWLPTFRCSRPLDLCYKLGS